MSGFFDVYALVPHRSAEASLGFLNAFVPEREQSSEYFITSKGTVIATVDELTRYCEAHPNEAQSVYFRNLSDGPAHAMVFFTEDGGLIWGLSVDSDEHEWLRRMMEYAGSQFGCITFEQPPPDTTDEFRKLCARQL